MQEPRIILHKIGLSESEIDVYLAMIGGAMTARDIIKVSRAKRPTVYYALGMLEKRGLVSRSGPEGERRFQLEPVERIEMIVQEQSRVIKKLGNDVKELTSSLRASGIHADNRPTVSFFEGIDAVKNVVMESLYCRGRHIDTVAPADNFFWQVGGDFAEEYVRERVKRGITTRSIWERPIDPSIYKRSYEKVSELRIAPAIMHDSFKTTTFLYDDKVLLISSRPNDHCLLIVSKEYHDTMQAWFNGLWDASTLYPIKKK